MATLRERMPPSPGRAVGDSAADMVTSGLACFASAFGIAWGTAMPSPTETGARDQFTRTRACPGANGRVPVMRTLEGLA
jgi:hypothetical protein